MNKKTVWICVLVLALLAVGIFVWKSCSSGQPATEGQGSDQIEEDAQAENSAQAADQAAGTAETEGSNVESAQLIEEEGDLIITLPEGEESDGF